MKFFFSSPRKPVQQRAFTLVEVMIGVTIMGIVFVTVYLGFMQGFSVIRATRESLRATQILQEQTEIIRLYRWDQLTNAAVIPAATTNYFYPPGAENQGTEYVTTISILPASTADITESYAEDLRLVTFQVTWTSGNLSHTNTMSTLVSQYGLQNYLF